MISTEVIPLLIVALLLLSAGGADVEQVDVVFDGTHAVTDSNNALIVGGGVVTVPTGETVNGPVYVIGGEAIIDGRVQGDVTLLSGNVSVGDSAVVTGELSTVAGRATIADGADVGAVRTIDVTTPNRSPFASYGIRAVLILVLAGVSWWVSRRYQLALANVADSITHHTLVSGVVGLLAGLTLLVLFVYMAFTLILLPVSIAGLAAEFLLVAYSYVVYGYIIGRHLPLERTSVASAIGAGIFLVGIDLLGQLPVLGGVLQFALLGIGFGAILITYFGLREFEPVRIPGGGTE